MYSSSMCLDPASLGKLGYSLITTRELIVTELHLFACWNFLYNITDYFYNHWSAHLASQHSSCDDLTDAKPPFQVYAWVQGFCAGNLSISG